MALGTNRTRNWGKEAQQTALALTLASKRVAYQLTVPRTRRAPNAGVRKELWLAASAHGITLPFTHTVASLVNVRRGLWHAESIYDGRLLATGVSERDVIRTTIEKVWQ